MAENCTPSKAKLAVTPMKERNEGSAALVSPFNDNEKENEESTTFLKDQIEQMKAVPP